MEMILSLLAGFLASLIRGVLADRRQQVALKELGRAEGATETLTRIVETADEQARINAADRGGAGDVARRLRERLAEPGGR